MHCTMRWPYDQQGLSHPWRRLLWLPQISNATPFLCWTLIVDHSYKEDQFRLSYPPLLPWTISFLSTHDLQVDNQREWYSTATQNDYPQHHQVPYLSPRPCNTCTCRPAVWPKQHIQYVPTPILCKHHSPIGYERLPPFLDKAICSTEHSHILLGEHRIDEQS